MLEGVNARRWAALLVLAVALAGGAGCRTAKPWLPADLSQPGWQVQRGQAIWTMQRNGPEIVGELLVAKRSGEMFLQFTKSPLPIAVARIEGERWQLHFVPRDYLVNGQHPEKSGYALVRLGVVLAGGELGEPWKYEPLPDRHWRLRNSKTGETVEGFFLP